MAFTFDSTESGIAANSYISVTQADDYFGGHPENSKWTALSLEQRQQYLVLATNRLDVEQFGGQRVLIAQRLQWPRYWVKDRDRDYSTTQIVDFVSGFFYREGIVKELIDCTCEQALHYIKMIELDSFAVSQDDLEIMSEYKVGPLQYKFKNKKADRLPTRVVNLLRALGPNAWVNSSSVRLFR